MITPGRMLYQLYYKPLDAVGKTFKRGIWRTTQQNKGEREMRHAAFDLREVTYKDKEEHTVYFLTGKKYWFQTAFCLYSLQRSAGVNIKAVLVDDGSFDDELEKTVQKQFPSTSVLVRTKELTCYLDEHLPSHRFPVLRQRRLVYPHLRKLTDVHVLPGEAPKLVLDSDMLFFKKPVELLDWLAKPDKMLFMRDVSESYGYTKEIMCLLTGTPSIPERLNVGVAGMASSEINWEVLERWTDETLKKEGTSYLQEQALTAMIAATAAHQFLDEVSYKVLPQIKGAHIPEILHHYVAEAKYDYFVKAWQFLLNDGYTTTKTR